METSRKHFHVYVIELDQKVLDVAKFRSANPCYVEGNACVYVGMTGRTPRERFRQHKSGYKASRFARRFGRRLVPAFYERFNPLEYDAAVMLEHRLAAHLRRRGFGVWQN